MHKLDKHKLKIYNYIVDCDNQGFKREVILEKCYSKGYDEKYIADICQMIKEDDEEKNRPKPKKESLFKRLFTKKVRVNVETEVKKQELDEPPKAQPEQMVEEEKEEIIVPRKFTPDPDIHVNQIKTETKRGINEKMDSIEKKLDMITGVKLSKKDLKNFALPNKVKSQMKKMAEKGKILVLLLKTNGNIEPLVTDIIDGFVCINNTPHDCSVDFRFLWKGKFPTIVLPEWDLRPIGTKDYDECVKAGRLAYPVATAIRMIESGEKLMKGQGMQFDMKTWIFIGIAVIAVIYIVAGGGN